MHCIYYIKLLLYYCIIKVIYSYCISVFTVLHSYNTAIVLEQELIFLGKPRFPLF